MALTSFGHSTQTLGADLHLHADAAVERQRRLLDVRFEGPVRFWRSTGPSAGVFVPDVTTEHNLFITDFTLCHNQPASLVRAELQMLIDTMLKRDYTISVADWQLL